MYESKEPYVPIFPAFDFVRLPLKRRGSTPVIQVRRDRPGVMPVFLFWASRKASKATAKQKRLQRSKPSTTAQDRDRADWAGQSSSHRPWWWSGARWVRQWSEALLQCRQGAGRVGCLGCCAEKPRLLAPSLAAAIAASTPAWPAPITITS